MLSLYCKTSSKCKKLVWQRRARALPIIPSVQGTYLVSRANVAKLKIENAGNLPLAVATVLSFDLVVIVVLDVELDSALVRAAVAVVAVGLAKAAAKEEREEIQFRFNCRVSPLIRSDLVSFRYETLNVPAAATAYVVGDDDSVTEAVAIANERLKQLSFRC